MKNAAPFCQSFLLPVCCKNCVRISEIYGSRGNDELLYVNRRSITPVTKESRKNIFFFVVIFKWKVNVPLHQCTANALCFDITFLRLQSTLNYFICFCKCSAISYSGINLTIKVLHYSFSVYWSK